MRKAQVELNLKKTAFTPTEIKAAEDRFWKQFHSESHDQPNCLLYETEAEESEGADVPRYSADFNFDQNHLSIDFFDTSIGDIMIQIPIGIDTQIALLEALVKKANKVKTILEAVS